MIITPPSISDTTTNDEYIITTIQKDPDLSSLFTLAKYDKEWNKASLIKTIQDILANGTPYTKPLEPVTYIVNKKMPGSEKSTEYILPLNANTKENKNIMKINDVNNYWNLFNSGYDEEGKNGTVTMQINNQNIVKGSNINIAYNIPDRIMDTKNGNIVTNNSGNQKCLRKINCTQKHYYKPNCQDYIDPSTNNCFCNCSPQVILNESGAEHTHCITQDFTDSILNYLNDISSVEMNFPVSYTSNSPSSITYDPDIDYLSNLIADYYILLLQNDSKKSNSDQTNITNNSKIQSKHQLYEDANELYKENYIKIVNISLGIVVSSYIIYAITK